MSEVYIGVVEKIVEGKHGPYLVVRLEKDKNELGAITLSLKGDWKEEKSPRPGTLVVLENLTRMRAGWRAGSGRFVRPSDKQ